MSDTRVPILMVQPWRCELCGDAGKLGHWSDQDAGQNMRAILDAHRLQRPECPGRIRVRDRYEPTAVEPSTLEG